MIEVIWLFVLFIFASIGMVTIIYIIGELKEERKAKRKEKFEQDVREVLFKELDQIKEEENAKV